MRVRQALVRVGYLRSYNGQASVLDEVTMNTSSPSGLAQRAASDARLSRVFNGTWNEPVSIFTTTSFDLRSIYCDQGEEELPPCLPPHRTASSCLMCGSRSSRMTAPLEAALSPSSPSVAGDRD